MKNGNSIVVRVDDEVYARLKEIRDDETLNLKSFGQAVEFLIEWHEKVQEATRVVLNKRARENKVLARTKHRKKAK